MTNELCTSKIIALTFRTDLASEVHIRTLHVKIRKYNDIKQMNIKCHSTFDDMNLKISSTVGWEGGGLR